MIVEIRVPSVGESVTEGQITEWLKQPGQAVRADEPIAILETDKVTVDILAPATGFLKEIRRAEGERVAVGEVIGTVETEGAPASEGPPRAVTRAPEGESGPGEAQRVPEALAPSPAVRRIAEETGIDLSAIPGTGKDGRVLKEDVLRHLRTAAPGTSGPAAPPAASLASTAPTAPARGTPETAGMGPPPARPAAAAATAQTGEPQPAQPKPGQRVPPEGSRLEERVPMTPIRRRIAERMLASRQTTATLTTFNEIDLSRVLVLRDQHKKRFQEKYQASLGLMSFFTKATIEALKAFPALNARIDGTDTVYHEYYDIGVAVSTDRGLVVPVLRNAERMSFAQTELAIADLGRRAREGKLTIEDLSGGTFTITNGGVFGSLLSTPILNPPQVGILGMHKIEKRPIVDSNDQVAVRPMMYVALSYDHRIVDGRDAVQFLVKVKECVEDPSRILLEV